MGAKIPALDPSAVIYEDNHLLVVNKPRNMPAQEDESKDPDLLTVLKEYRKKHEGKPGNAFVGLVQRLDRPVGGITVFAKTSKAAARLSEQIRTRTFEKTYLAVAKNVPEKLEGRLVHYLLKDEQTNTVSTASSKHPGAKEAILFYETLGSVPGLSLLKVRLETGRSHQIRVQMAAIGCPLYGDQKYAADTSKPGQQLALWSYAVRFAHPVRDEAMAFTLRPPHEYPWDVFRLPS